MENLEKLIYDLYKKNARQCTNEEIYNALLIYTKNQLFEKGYHNGKKTGSYISQWIGGDYMNLKGCFRPLSGSYISQ